jgi:hypothetical protein
MKFKASYDKIAIIITVAVTFICGVIFILMLRMIPADTAEIAVITIVLIALICLPVLSFLFSPRNYILDNEEIVIKRILKSVLIKYADIIDIAIPDEKLMKNSCRSGGSGGLFGYYGNFYNKNFRGDMKWYVTQMKKFVIIKAKKTRKEFAGPYSRKSEIIVLSPDNTMEFMNELKMKIKSSAGGSFDSPGD